MTTAHRPTWKAAVGRKNDGAAVSTVRAVKDEPAHTKLKFRTDHGADVGAQRKALQESLLALEQAETENKKPSFKRPTDPELEKRGRQRLLKQTAEVDLDRIAEQYGDEDASASESESDLDDDAIDDDGSEGNDSDEDDEAALQAELTQIKAERAQAAAVKDQQQEAAEQTEAAMVGNPLLQMPDNMSHSGKRKRAWNEDVVFRNQAKSEPTTPKRFINDTVRNDFHKRFLNKFIR